MNRQSSCKTNPCNFALKPSCDQKQQPTSTRPTRALKMSQLPQTFFAMHLAPCTSCVSHRLVTIVGLHSRWINIPTAKLCRANRGTIRSVVSTPSFLFAPAERSPQGHPSIVTGRGRFLKTKIKEDVKKTTSRQTPEFSSGGVVRNWPHVPDKYGASKQARPQFPLCMAFTVWVVCLEFYIPLKNYPNFILVQFFFPRFSAVGVQL
ncbi:hypothetical protein CRV24_009468 [Beauveria bassiana]|nr:hypothetical protein CRV24_009468 [Beauveria bassiana]